MNTNRLQKKIMRGIYYAYVVRVLANPALLHGFFMLALLIALTYFVSIGDVIANLMHVEVGRLGIYTYNTLSNTEAWTLVIIGLLIFSALSLRFKVRTPHQVARPHFARSQ